MAMSVEQVNKRLAKVLKDLDSAIEDRDLKKVDEVIKKAETFNKNSQGKAYESILNAFNEKIKEIAEQIKTDKDLDVDEKKELANIKNKIKSGKDPFEKINKVVDNLSKKGISQEDLINHKESQKNDNKTQIKAIEKNNLELATGIADIEMRYITKIQDNDAAVKIIEDIKKEKDLIESLDSTVDGEAIDQAKTSIKDKITELSSKGVDVKSIQGFESNLSVIDSFHSTKISELNQNSDTIASSIANDSSIAGKLATQYDLANVTNATDLKDRFKGMVKTRQKNATKIATLKAENKQIDETIKKLELEKEEKSYAYNEDGTRKSDDEIRNAILNSSHANRLERDVSAKLKANSKNPFKKLVARIDYYKQTQKEGRFSTIRAVCKAFTHKTKSVKMIAMNSMAVDLGVQVADNAVGEIGRRQNDFKEAIRREAAKKMSKDSKLTENDVRDDVMETAYKSASYKTADKGNDEER